jgi:glycine dehydrogenase subunit 1
MQKIATLPGVKIQLAAPSFKEFVVNFDMTGKTVAQINKHLLQFKIFGGKDLSQEFPQFGQSALYCVTEIHQHKDWTNSFMRCKG